MKLFGIHLDDAQLTPEDLNYLQKWSHETCPPVELIWAEMDAAWDACFAEPLATGTSALEVFYRHPVWLLNGIFTEVDPTSVGHREEIAREVASLRPKVVCDYGGGFGSLARRLAGLMPSTRIDIVEPYPHPAALELAKPFQNLAYVDELPSRADVVIAQDVLEHVHCPIDLTAKLILPLETGGVFISASCFQPVIKCHLQETFHLLQTFRHCVAPLGLDFIKTITGASHAEVFRRNATPSNLARARRREWASCQLSPISRKLQRWVARLL